MSHAVQSYKSMPTFFNLLGFTVMRLGVLLCIFGSLTKEDRGEGV